MPSHCWNGNLCKFKPKCHYFHPEGGNKIKTKENSGKGNDKNPIENQINDKQPMEDKYNDIWEFSFIYFGKKYENNRLVKTDFEAMKEVVQQQVNLLGSDRLYQRVDKNLREYDFEAIFAKDQFKLYSWREEFFYRKFGHHGQRNSFGMRTWYASNGDPEDTVPYQITQNFDDVMALACSTENNHNADTSIFFEDNEVFAWTAKYIFDKDFLELETRLEDGSIAKDVLDKHMSISFSDVAHMIVAKHCIGPCSLLEAAMKAVLLHDLPLHELPRELQNKAKNGLYSAEDPIPTNLSLAGQQIFSKFHDDLNHLMENSVEEEVV